MSTRGVSSSNRFPPIDCSTPFVRCSRAPRRARTRAAESGRVSFCSASPRERWRKRARHRIRNADPRARLLRARPGHGCASAILITSSREARPRAAALLPSCPPLIKLLMYKSDSLGITRGEYGGKMSHLLRVQVQSGPIAIGAARSARNRRPASRGGPAACRLPIFADVGRRAPAGASFRRVSWSSMSRFFNLGP